MTGSELRERTFVVAGGGGGTGRAIAVALQSAGATVYEAADDVEGLARDVIAREGGIDFLVHSAGMSAQNAAEIQAAHQVTEAFLPGLCANEGQVVFVSSTVELTATTARTVLWNSLRRAVNPRGLRSLSVYASAAMQRPEDVASAVLGALTPA
jgi:NAD(P)-dependent dehydrogenase (short-subunit alcohol dehydrogenase family)